MVVRNKLSGLGVQTIAASCNECLTVNLNPSTRLQTGYDNNNLCSFDVECRLNKCAKHKFNSTMETRQALKGMATVSFWADDVKAARKWYNELLETTPYFERPNSENPAYVEYRFGDYQAELGIIDRKYAPKAAQQGPGGAVLYWHVEDVKSALERLLKMGCKEYEALTQITHGGTDHFPYTDFFVTLFCGEGCKTK